MIGLLLFAWIIAVPTQAAVLLGKDDSGTSTMTGTTSITKPTEIDTSLDKYNDPVGATNATPAAQTYDTSIGQQGTPLCNPAHAAAYQNGREQALLNRLARNEAYFKYSVSAAMAAQCSGKLLEYAQKLYQAFGQMGQIASSADLVTAALSLVATQIMDAIYMNLLNQLNNQICAVTNQILNYADSIVQNAICLPQGQMSPFNFSPTNLNLPTTTCNGIAFNPLGLINQINTQNGNPPNLYDTSSGISLVGTALDPDTTIGGTVGTALMGSSIVGLGGFSYGPMGGNNGVFRPEFPVDIEAFDGYKENETPADGSDLASSYMPSGNGCMGDFLNRVIKRESGSCTTNISGCSSGSSYQCQNSIGMLGAFQFSMGTLESLGCLSCPASGCNSKNYAAASWTGRCGGATSTCAFLNSPAAQQAAELSNFKKNWNYLDAYENLVGKQVTYAIYKAQGCLVQGAHGCTKYNCVQVGTKTTTITESGIIGASQLGPGNVEDFLQAAATGKMVNFHDGYCTTIGSYIDYFQGYDVTPLTGTNSAKNSACH